MPVLRHCLCLFGVFAALLMGQGAVGQDGDGISDLSEGEIRKFQAALLFLGYEIEIVSGYYGDQTTRAVEAFEFSVGMGNEGRLDAGERALLDAQVIALSYEKFGYRLRGYWSSLPCNEDTAYQHGFWLDDLAVLDGPTAIPLIEQTLPAPLLIDLDGAVLSLSSSYLTPYNNQPDLRLFPVQDRMIAVLQGQAQAIYACESDLPTNQLD